MPAEASDTLGQYAATVLDYLDAQVPGECSRIKAVTVHSHRPETARKLQSALCQTHHPKLK